MNGNSPTQPLTILLSRALLAVLEALHVPAIPGLDREPSGELTPDQQAFAVVVARRALLARELAQIRPDGEFVIHRAVLDAVGACAYWQEEFQVYHWPAGAQAPESFFGHINQGRTVVHTRPDAVPAPLALLDSRAALVESMLAFCQCTEPPLSTPLAFAALRATSPTCGSSRPRATRPRRSTCWWRPACGSRPRGPL